MPLEKQIWTDQLMSNFYPEVSFLQFAKDFSSLVEYDKLHMAEVGVDPDVLVNNTTYPIRVLKRDDVPLEFELDLFETENTLVRQPEVVERSYDQLESVIYGHKQSLRTKTAIKAAHAYAPLQNTAFTPVIVTTGEDDGTGRKRLTIADILRLKRMFDANDYPKDKRFLVLDPLHTEDLILLDTKSFKDITDFKDGEPKRFAGFNMLEFTKNPMYNAETNEKIPFGAIPEGVTATFSSFAFVSDEVMKADGSVGMYARENDPEERATIVGFDKRFVALPIRNKGIGAIVSANV